MIRQGLDRKYRIIHFDVFDNEVYLLDERAKPVKLKSLAEAIRCERTMFAMDGGE